jgi:aminocarboxymuconate-semialdehyde decarboxylase
MDNGCRQGSEDCDGSMLKKKASKYMKQMYFDSLVFTSEALRHLVSVCDASQMMIGTD